MDKLTNYSTIIKQILTEYIQLSNRRPNPDIETFLIVDEPNGHYIWMNIGWQKGDRINDMTVYVRLLNGKFWIEEDWTENGIANRLLSKQFLPHYE